MEALEDVVGDGIAECVDEELRIEDVLASGGSSLWIWRRNPGAQHRSSAVNQLTLEHGKIERQLNRLRGRRGAERSFCGL